jgi:hypothetical protein
MISILANAVSGQNQYNPTSFKVAIDVVDETHLVEISGPFKSVRHPRRRFASARQRCFGNCQLKITITPAR